jgi:hypothetical protein
MIDYRSCIDERTYRGFAGDVKEEEAGIAVPVVTLIGQTAWLLAVGHDKRSHNPSRLEYISAKGV